jgi:hypothetical protein
MYRAMQNAKKRPYSKLLGVASVSFAISVVSFILSLVSTYYSVIQQKDDIRGIVGEVPTIQIDEGTNEFIISGPFSLVFFNAGNRAAAYLGGLFRLTQDVKWSVVAEKCEGGTTMSLGGEKTVVKERDIVIHKTTLEANGLAFLSSGGSIRGSDTGVYRVPLAPEIRDEKIQVATICARLWLATPSNADINFDVPLGQTKFVDGNINDKMYLSTKRPFPLWRSTGTIFAN